jgi:hypothetical protein
MEQPDSRTDLRNNLAFVIAGAIVLAIAIIAAGFMSYYSSPTKKILDQLQANQIESTAKTSIEKLKSTGPVTAEEVDALLKVTQDDISARDADADYSSDALTDSVLGL